MLGAPIGLFVASSWRRQTTLHVETFNMSDRVELNGRSTCDECMCNGNMYKLFLNCSQAHLAPKPPVFESRRMHECSCKHANLMITHNDQATNQTIHFKHNNNITWTKKQSWETIQIRCDQLTEPHGSCQILRCWYTSEPPHSPVSQKSEE